MSFMEVEFSDPAHPLDYVPEDYHHLTNGWDVTLPPGSTLQFTCPAPTNHFHWRAGVSGIGHRQITLQKALRRAWLFKDYIPPLLALHSEYAWTEWLPPEPAKPH